MNHSPVRAFIVDDSAITRQVLTRELNRPGNGIQVIGSAPDPYAARDMIVNEKPDVLLLDLNMPRMDGMTFLKKIVQHFPMPVIIVSSLTPKGSEMAMTALQNGAVDVICKPGSGADLKSVVAEMVEKIKAVSNATVKKSLIEYQQAPKTGVSLPESSRRHLSRKIIAIGSSTGGTEALASIFAELPSYTPPVLVVQHMPANFTKPFSERLDGLSGMSVKEAENGDYLRQGLALIAPGDRHMRLRQSAQGYRVEVLDGPLVSRHRPSVNVLFRSVAKLAAKRTVGVMLTGMGDDGAEGMLEMKNAGSTNIAQDEKSCVVFGMPKEAIRLGGADHVVPLENIAEKMLQLAAKAPN